MFVKTTIPQIYTGILTAEDEIKYLELADKRTVLHFAMNDALVYGALQNSIEMTILNLELPEEYTNYLQQFKEAKPTELYHTLQEEYFKVDKQYLPYIAQLVNRSDSVEHKLN